MMALMVIQKELTTLEWVSTYQRIIHLAP